MKWMALAPIILFLTSCCCNYPSAVRFRNVVTTTPSVVVTPTYYAPVTVIDTDPIDVTTTTIDYY
ncbi:MAG: hypothetical protein LCH30_06845 [Proteobacteria bacterium]|nr:hypothetical protein [Pseudomonadota bacterium]